MRLPLGLDGPAPVWPRPVDAVLEAWAGLPGRARAAVRAAGVVVVVLAASGGLVRGPYGPPVTVLVARHDIPAGASFGLDDVTPARWPRDLVPADALVPTSGLGAGAITTGAVPAGGVVTARHVVLGGPSALARHGTAVLPLPAELLPQLPVGTLVDLAATTLDGDAEIVAREATIVAGDETWRWVRVERTAVAAVAGAISRGALVVAVLPPEPPGDVP